MNKTPQITAIICTHNRATLLPQAVRSLFTQTLSAEVYEVLIVKNACGDATQQVIDSVIDLRPRSLSIRALNEPKLGLSHARNVGLAAARGEYVAFLDDDATADPNWLCGLTETLALSPRIAAVGGSVHPIWPFTPPAWLDDSLSAYYSVLNYGNATREINTAREWLVGTNIALRHSALAEIGGFAANLGRHGSSLLSNEEVDVVQKLVGRGYQAWYTPNASVAHHIHAHRLTRRWILSRAFWQGVSDVIMRQPNVPPAVIRLTRRRVDFLLLRSFGKEWFKDYLSHDLMQRGSRMSKLVSDALQLGKRFAQSSL